MGEKQGERQEEERKGWMEEISERKKTGMVARDVMAAMMVRENKALLVSFSCLHHTHDDLCVVVV